MLGGLGKQVRRPLMWIVLALATLEALVTVTEINADAAPQGAVIVFTEAAFGEERK
jgi:hypothetical protein